MTSGTGPGARRLGRLGRAGDVAGGMTGAVTAPPLERVCGVPCFPSASSVARGVRWGRGRNSVTVAA